VKKQPKILGIGNRKHLGPADGRIDASICIKRLGRGGVGKYAGVKLSFETEGKGEQEENQKARWHAQPEGGEGMKEGRAADKEGRSLGSNLNSGGGNLRSVDNR